MIKIAFFDIDGTIYSHKSHSIPKSTKIAINLLKEKGILVFTATGRGYCELAELGIHELGFDGHVLLSGQLCIDQNQNVIYENPLHPDDLLILKELFDAKEYGIMVTEKDRMYINVVNDDIINMQKQISSAIPEVGEYHGANVYQISIAGDREKLIDFDRHFNHAELTYWTKDFIDLIRKGGGKANGIKHVLNHYNFNESEMLAIGDANNDLGMLKMAQISICMGNGEQEAKTIADYVTSDIDDNGFYNSLVNFSII